MANETLDEGRAHDAAVAHETFLGIDSYGWVGVAFAVFLILLWRFGLFSMISRALDGQAEKVRASLAEAESLRLEAQALKDRAAAEARQAKQDAEAIRLAAEADAARILAGAEAEAEAAIARATRLAEDRITSAQRAAETELRARATELAVRAAKTLLVAHQKELQPLTDASIAALDRRS